LGALEPFAARGAPARAHVLGEGRDAREILLDARGDEIARALPPDEEPFLDQAVDGLANGDPRNREIGGDLPLGGKGVVRGEEAVFDRFAQRSLQLLVERLVGAGIEGLEDFGQGRHRNLCYQSSTNMQTLDKVVPKWITLVVYWHRPNAIPRETT